jgi:hypothetical protein
MRPPPATQEFTNIRPIVRPPTEKPPVSAGAQPDYDAIARKYGGKSAGVPAPTGYEEIPAPAADTGRLVLPPDHCTPARVDDFFFTMPLNCLTLKSPLASPPASASEEAVLVPLGCSTLPRASDGTLLLPLDCAIAGLPTDSEHPAVTHHHFIFWPLTKFIVVAAAGLFTAFGIGLVVGRTATWKALVARWVK